MKCEKGLLYAGNDILLADFLSTCSIIHSLVRVQHTCLESGWPQQCSDECSLELVFLVEECRSFFSFPACALFE